MFKSQEKLPEENLKLIDIEKFLLKVTSKRPPATPSHQNKVSSGLSYIPANFMKGWSPETVKLQEHINYLKDVNSKVKFLSPNQKDSKALKKVKLRQNSGEEPMTFLHLPHLHN